MCWWGVGECGGASSGGRLRFWSRSAVLGEAAVCGGCLGCSGAWVWQGGGCLEGWCIGAWASLSVGRSDVWLSGESEWSVSGERFKFLVW